MSNHMLTEKKIREIVESQIRQDNELGERAGGSGHLSYVSYRIDEIIPRDLQDGRTEIAYTYTLIIETEFTYYPDNPPYEDPRSGIVIVDASGKEVNAGQ